MRKAITLFSLATFFLVGCNPDTPPAPITENPVPTEWTSCSVEAVQENLGLWTANWVFLPEQITACYKLGEQEFAFISQPNTWTALPTVREWEKEGNTAISGVLSIKEGLMPELLFQIPDADFNPVGIFGNEEQWTIDAADDSVASSGEGALMRYTRQKESPGWSSKSCTNLYIPETYAPEEAACDSSVKETHEGLWQIQLDPETQSVSYSIIEWLEDPTAPDGFSTQIVKEDLSRTFTQFTDTQVQILSNQGDLDPVDLSFGDYMKAENSCKEEPFTCPYYSLVGGALFDVTYNTDQVLTMKQHYTP